MTKEFKQSGSEDEVEFTIDGDAFTALAPRRLPANVLIRYAESIGEGKLFAAHERFFADVLTEEGYKTFYDRLDSNVNPINIDTMIQVASYLVGEVYGGGNSVPSKP